MGLTNLCRGGVNYKHTWHFQNLSVGLDNLIKSHIARNSKYYHFPAEDNGKVCI